MPIYAYRCASCGHAKDVLQKLSDPPLTVCPACGAQAFAKQVTAAGFQLKGSGWYATDFKGNGAKKPDGGDATKADDTKSDGSKGDGAPAEAGKADGTKSGDAAAPSPKAGDAGTTSSGGAAGGPSPASKAASSGGAGAGH